MTLPKNVMKTTLQLSYKEDAAGSTADTSKKMMPMTRRNSHALNDLPLSARVGTKDWNIAGENDLSLLDRDSLLNAEGEYYSQPDSSVLSFSVNDYRSAGSEYSLPHYRRAGTAIYNGYADDNVSGIVQDESFFCAELTSQSLPFLQVELADIEDAQNANGIIAPYLRTRGLDDLYALLLDRVEGECGRPVVQDVLSLLWCSHRGMSEDEIAELTGRRKNAIVKTITVLENHLAHRDGLVAVLQDDLRMMVERRYLGSASNQHDIRVRIAEYFAAQPLNNRRLDEEPWQWAHTADLGRLRACLVNIPMTIALIAQERRTDLFTYWGIIERSCDLVEEYERGLMLFEAGRADAVEHAEIFHALSDFYAESYRYDMAKILLERCLAVREDGNGREAAYTKGGGSDMDRAGRTAGTGNAGTSYTTGGWMRAGIRSASMQRMF